MKENKTILIDTNILVYAYTDSDPLKQRLALSLLEKCWKREAYYAVSLQNLAEFFSVVTRKNEREISKEHITKIIFDIIHFSHWKIIQYTPQGLISATRRENNHFWDCLIAATMLENNITHIYTENTKDFSSFPNITAENPFRKA